MDRASDFCFKSIYGAGLIRPVSLSSLSGRNLHGLRRAGLRENPVNVLRSVLIVFLLFLTSLACTRQAETPTVDQEPLKVGWYLWSGWYPMAIAQELDLFRKHGADIKPILYKNYTAILPDFATGKLDGCFSGLYEALKSGIPDLKVILVTDYSEGAEGLVVTKDISTPKDLKGKRIGIQGSLSGSEFIVTTYLRDKGLSPRDLVMVDIEPQSILAEMPNNIQGGYTWDPFLSLASAKGHRILFTTADTPGMIPDIIAFRGRITSDRAKGIRGFTKAWFEAVDYWDKHPEQAAQIIAKVTGLSIAEINRNGCRQLNAQENRKVFTPADDFSSLHYTGRRQIDFFIGMGDASFVPDLQAILDPSFLPMEEN